jgi:hypothetical protein
MEIQGFEELPDRFNFIEESGAEWAGRYVKQKEVDPRIHFVRSLVFAYLYHMIALPQKLASFERRLLEALFEEEEEFSTEDLTLRWIGRNVEQRQRDPRLEFVRDLVFTYLYHIVVTPEKLPSFEQKILDILFDDDEEETLNPLIFVNNLSRLSPILV